MSTAVVVEDVERFRGAIARRLGLRFDDAKVGFLGEVLRRRLEVTDRDCDAYLRDLEDDIADADLGALAEELTVPETYFFRNIDQFHAFAQRVVPERTKARLPERRLRILSAGCASGEEPYTLAIVLREILEPGWSASVLGVDLNASMLEKAQRGRYSEWALREAPLATQQRWFEGNGRHVVLDDAIRSAVTFQQRNLADDNADLWRANTYDAVFCRNVIMYFTPSGARALVNRIARALVPGGYLFLGHAETLRGVTRDFHLCHTHGTFYYQRKATLGEPSATDSSFTAGLDTGDPPAIASLVEVTDTWVDAIRMASDRVQQLVDDLPARTHPHASPAPPARARWDLGRALDLLRQERFADALELVEALPPDVADGADVLLLSAVLLTHAGLLTRAEQSCRRLLDIDELTAGAHYVLALCREGMGDPAGAVEHDRMAAYLDPRFAMPRVHLGLLARRAGDVARTQRELELAAKLLEGEDTSRLLLFGGGFSREALIALCRAEMQAGG